MPKTEAVRVVVRCRPLNSKEKAANYPVVVSMDTTRGNVAIKNPKGGPDEPPKNFTFDAVFDWNCTQTMVFEDTAQPIVDSVLEGYNGTIFAYGQTGTGKTFTMEGVANPPELRGVIPRSFEHIFETIDVSENRQHLVRASYLEIYNEQVRDLLGNDPHKKLDLKESADKGVYVKDLTSYVVKNKNEIADVMAKGHKNRSVGSTEMNATSSRSHSIFTIIIEISEETGGEAHIRQGKLNLVDLAGSERANKTGAQGDRLKEGCNINLSLSALGNVISALVDGKSKHIPYRDSKLTRLLQDSLGGNARTVMVANMGPADYNYDESLSTLRYANRAKNIKNKPKINEDPKDAMLREFQEEIQKLREQLQMAAGGMPIDMGALGGMAGGAGGEGGTRTITVADENLIRELQEKSEEEKKALLEQQNLAEERRKMIEDELAKREEALAKERESHEALQKKLQALEQNLVVGGVHVVDKVKLQEKELKKAEREMARKKAEQEQMQKELQEREEARMLAEEKFNSIQQEVEIKTKRLKQLNHKYQGAKAEIRDLTEEFEREREDLLDTVRELTAELKLNRVILENFIPDGEIEKIRSRAQWDDELDDWRIQSVHKAGKNIRRPQISDKSQSQAAMRRERQFRQNVGLGMNMPDRTTIDSDGEPGALSYMRADVQGEVLRIPTTLDNMYLTYDGKLVDPEKTSESTTTEKEKRPKDKEKKRRPSSSRKSRTASAGASRDKKQFQHLQDSDRPRSGSSGSRSRVKDPLDLLDAEQEELYPKARGLVSRS